MIHEKRRVDLKLGILTGETVLLGCIGGVVPGGKIFEMDPGEPGGGIAARCGTARLDLAGGIPDLVPGLGRIVDVEARFLENILVEIEDRR